MSEATATDANLGTLRIVKGAFTVVATMAAPSPTAAAAATELEGKGFRVLAVAAGPPAGPEQLQQSGHRHGVGHHPFPGIGGAVI